jgi:hypothetical protein
MNNKIIVSQDVDNIATAWIPTEDNRTVEPHRIFCDGAFSEGENSIENVKEVPQLNGNTSFDLTLDGSPTTVVTSILHPEMDKKIIEHYRSMTI